MSIVCVLKSKSATVGRITEKDESLIGDSTGEQEATLGLVCVKAICWDCTLVYQSNFVQILKYIVRNFFITFENKEMIPPEKDLRNNRGCDESTEASLQFFHLPAED